MTDDVSGYPGAPPGWYPDPAGGPGQRWWDGYAWTEATVLPAVPPPPPPHPSSFPPPPRHAPAWQPTPPDAEGLVGRELRVFSLGRLTIAFPGLVALVDVIAWAANAAQWREFGHQFRVAMDEPRGSQIHPTVPNSLGAFSSLLVLAAIAALVLTCIWQFRAATAARALRYPAKRSPGWGVAFWFIPIVNFWMPYQAIRDCLAPTDPGRAVVRRYWLFTLGIELGSLVTGIALMTSTAVGVVFAILTALCALGILATAPRVVTSIATAHRAAVNP